MSNHTDGEGNTKSHSEHSATSLGPREEGSVSISAAELDASIPVDVHSSFLPVTAQQVAETGKLQAERGFSVVRSDASAASFFSADDGEAQPATSQADSVDLDENILSDIQRFERLDEDVSSPSAHHSAAGNAATEPTAVERSALDGGTALETTNSENQGSPIAEEDPAVVTPQHDGNSEPLRSVVGKEKEVLYLKQLKKVTSTLKGDPMFLSPTTTSNRTIATECHQRRASLYRVSFEDQQLGSDIVSEPGGSDSSASTRQQYLDDDETLPSKTGEEHEAMQDGIPAPERPGSPTKRYGSEHDDWWQKEPKHVFMLTSSGKPVYTYHGDESALAGFMAVLQAMMSVVKDNGDTLKSVRAGRHVFVFLECGPFYLAAMSALQEDPAVLAMQLELLYKQLVMILSGAVDHMVRKNPRFDVRNLLGGTDAVLRNLISSFRVDPAAMLCAAPSLPLEPNVRQATTTCLQKAVKAGGGVYGVLLCPPFIVSVVHPSGQPLHPHDLLLLANFVDGTQSFRQAEESFSPLCLPHVNATAFFHSYIRYLDSAQRLAVVIIATAAELFYSMREAVTGMEQELQANGGMKGLTDTLSPSSAIRSGRLPLSFLPTSTPTPAPPSASQPQPSTSPGTDPPLVLHWAYKHNGSDQMAMAGFEGPLKDPALQEAVVATYGRVRHLLINAKPGAPPHRMYFEGSSRWVVLVQMSANFEMYVVMDPLTDKGTAGQVATRLSSWIKSQASFFFHLP